MKMLEVRKMQAVNQHVHFNYVLQLLGNEFISRLQHCGRAE